MNTKKEIELQKYLDKKRKQKNRDELMQQIVKLSKNTDTSVSREIRKKIKRKKTVVDIIDDSSKSNEDYKGDSNVNNELSYSDGTGFNELDIDANINRVVEIVPVDEKDINLCENTVYKDSILSCDEKYVLKRCNNRIEAIQEKRMKLDIFYDEQEIISTIKYNLIVFIQGNTGCGKTTQIPQFLYENGFTDDRMICITQPRRFSAVSISHRINEEMNEQVCGYKIKYENNITNETKIKVVTEGVLFKEIQSDFLLLKYSVIILDEVHERSTNSDILVGLLSRIVQKRIEMKKPLRLILMSATLDVTCYKKILGEYSIIKLKQKPHEISIFYEDTNVENYLESTYNKIVAILDSEKEKKSNKKQKGGEKIPITVQNNKDSSILVFLPSKDDIFKLKEKLDAANKDIIVLPLYSGLNKKEQTKVYEKFEERKVILATNIAETSVTIDGIVFVIDSGKVKRKYTDHNSILYKIDFISKSSACQRTGRCGRTGPGVCYRMYSGDQFALFQEHDVPKILVEPFDSTLLQLKGMGISNVFGFPFIDQPTTEMIKDSIEALQNIKAIDSKGNITRLGKSICMYPVVPRLARLLITSMDEEPTIYSKIVIIISVLSTNFEYRRNEDTEEFYNLSKSDLIVGLKIFLDAHKFRRYKNISKETYNEIVKLSSYLFSISGKGNIENCLNESLIDDEHICKLLFYAFADQLAINCGSYYTFKEGDLFVSKDSIDTNGMNFVFDHIVCGTKRSYATGITLVSPSLFKIQ